MSDPRDKRIRCDNCCISLEPDDWDLVPGYAAHEISRLTALLAERDGELELARKEAEGLALNLWQNHYMADSPQFELCDSVAGVITQIDNMATGIAGRLAAAEQDAGRLDALQRFVDRMGGLTIHNGQARPGYPGLGLKNTNRTLREALDALESSGDG